MPYVDVAGTRIHYTVTDQDADWNLICIHGAAGDTGIWPASLGESRACNTYCIDLPGHGRSGGRLATRIADYAAAVRGFVEALGLDNVVLAGHSMGGAIAQQLALEGPDWLRGMVLVATGARLRAAPEFMDISEEQLPDVIEKMAAATFGPNTPAAVIENEKARLATHAPEVLASDFTACNGFDVTDELHRMDVPTLIISGDIDHMTPLKYSQFLEDKLPNAQLAVIAPAGHMLPLEQPAELSRLIRGFVEARSRQ
ncbi:MAG: alpha/beta hydrolase [Ectothiorhodospiraceae bacterium]|nr:alpha/beta hydrolase [Ectothiorhodospiraceae bacterium]